jgi:hypothetical protein
MDMAVNLIHSGKVVGAVEALVGTLE